MKDKLSPISELYSLRDDIKDIQEELEILEQLRSIATSVTVATDKEAVQSSGSQDKMAKIVAKIVDLENLINEKVDDFVDTKEFAKSVIFEIENENYQNVLYDFFILNIPLYQIAETYEIKYNNAKQWLHRGKAEYVKLCNARRNKKIQDIACVIK